MQFGMNIIDILIVMAYFVIVIIVGVKLSTKQTSLDEFSSAGKSLGKIAIGFGLAATDIGGAVVVGAIGLVYAIGITGSWWDFCAIPGYVLLGLFLVGRIRSVNLSTVPEFLEMRYGLNSRIFAAVLQVCCTTVFLICNLIVSSLAITAMTGISHNITMIVSVVIFCIYTATGGFKAVVYNDVFQFVLTTVAILISLPIAWHAAGGWGNIHSTLPASMFDFMGLGKMEIFAWIAMCFFAYGTSQQILQRVFTAKDASTARFGYLFAAVAYFVFGLISIVLGLSAAVLFPGLASQDNALVMIVRDILPVGLSGLMMAAIFAASMSSSGSYISASTTVFVIDIYKRLIKQDADEKHYVLVSRITVVAIGIIALILSVFFQNIIQVAVFGTLVYSAPIFFPLILGFFWKRGTGAGAFSGMITGAVAGVISYFFIYQKTAGLMGLIHPMFVASIASLVIFVTVSLCTRHQENSELDAKIAQREF